jgi:hypothetical protein
VDFQKYVGKLGLILPGQQCTFAGQLGRVGIHFLYYSGSSERQFLIQDHICNMFLRRKALEGKQRDLEQLGEFQVTTLENTL